MENCRLYRCYAEYLYVDGFIVVPIVLSKLNANKNECEILYGVIKPVLLFNPHDK